MKSKDQDTEIVQSGNVDNSEDSGTEENIIDSKDQTNLEQSETDDEAIENTNDDRNRMRVLKTADHIVGFKNVIREINNMDFKVININMQKLTPDDKTVIANLDGKYPNKEEKDVTLVDGKIVPNTVQGLLANGTKFFDAIVYHGIDEERRPKPIEIQFEKADDGTIEIPTYDDMAKLTTYIFVAYFFVVIRAHAPSDSGIYANQPMPNFISNIMNCRATISEVSEYISSFDLIKLSPEWVKYIPTTCISQESVNRLGLGVAGYRLVSVFNVVEPDMYTDKAKNDEEYRYKTKPTYLDTAVTIMRSFRQAGYCWDFHPATRSPDIMSKYGNINKNAGNLMLECYTKRTLKKLLEIKKLSVIPTFDYSHTEYRTWTR
ncbi:hypothetical protein OnM2_052075 [Erysiphe neolycopersici]|uniref:Uncharacterized protein n=1 Tax=Erysiphe neolycopersici TaxID=212602 RepID=A0A420HS67_9PEZI|nr:hypothetical protein OnM2_052075 [Erysiphe neolycopersici]